MFLHAKMQYGICCERVICWLVAPHWTVDMRHREKNLFFFKKISKKIKIDLSKEKIARQCKLLRCLMKYRRHEWQKQVEKRRQKQWSPRSSIADDDTDEKQTMNRTRQCHSFDHQINYQNHLNLTQMKSIHVWHNDYLRQTHTRMYRCALSPAHLYEDSFFQFEKFTIKNLWKIKMNEFSFFFAIRSVQTPLNRFIFNGTCVS